MAVHTCKKKTSAQEMAKRFRRMGLNATVSKAKNGYRVYTDQKGRR